MENKNIRLNRYLAQCGLGSRRECDSIIASGKIFINDKKVIELGTRINPDEVELKYRGKTIEVINRIEYFAYYKPRDTIVTKKDPEGRNTIYNSLKKSGFNADHLKYIGRLDRNSEGLLLLTNDGDLIHALTHPRFQIKKVYQTRIDKKVSQEDQSEMIHEGVVSRGQRLHLGSIREMNKNTEENEYWYEIDLYEGKNRQIRRIFEAKRFRVLRLKRIQFSAVKLGALKRGRWRTLSMSEIKALKSKGYK
ncbi:MAG: pseudouridine synthase [Chitinispirillia bacterium]|jgi:23S rRNA pseudouridine2605 synthase